MAGKFVPIMPWRSYVALSDEDTHLLALYLKSPPPASTPPIGLYGLGEHVFAP